MDIVSTFRDHFNNMASSNNYLTLVRYSENLFIGIDENGYTTVVLKSRNTNRAAILQRTRMLSVECNVGVVYELEGIKQNDVVHILRCFADAQKEREIFLELSALLIMSTSEEQEQEEAILETLSILSSFFANKSEPSDTELRGLYAELYTIWSYRNSLQIYNYWQSTDKMKFDFSITSEMKIEVKSTIKNERRHHFKHDQLATEIYDVYVVSYLLRADDEGLSLLELINNCKPLFFSHPQKLIKIDQVLKNSSESRLSNLKFAEEFTIAKRKFFSAKKIPRFEEQSPAGIFNAEYDCSLDGVEDISEEDFISLIMTVIAKN